MLTWKVQMAEELSSLLALSQKLSGYYIWVQAQLLMQLKTVHPNASFKHSIAHSFVVLNSVHGIIVLLLHNRAANNHQISPKECDNDTKTKWKSNSAERFLKVVRSHALLSWHFTDSVYEVLFK